jgi:hypothetical protein
MAIYTLTRKTFPPKSDICNCEQSKDAPFLESTPLRTNNVLKLKNTAIDKHFSLLSLILPSKTAK